MHLALVGLAEAPLQFRSTFLVPGRCFGGEICLSLPGGFWSIKPREVRTSRVQIGFQDLGFEVSLCTLRPLGLGFWS